MMLRPPIAAPESGNPRNRSSPWSTGFPLRGNWRTFGKTAKMLGILQDSEIDDFLASRKIGRLGCHYQGKTYVVPIQYRFKGDHLLCYSMEGMKLDFLRSNPHVCFEVDQIESLNHWTSVILWGRFVELGLRPPHAEDWDWFSLENLESKTRPNSPPPDGQRLDRPPQGARHRQAIFYRIEITEKSGRYEKPIL